MRNGCFKFLTIIFALSCSLAAPFVSEGAPGVPKQQFVRANDLPTAGSSGVRDPGTTDTLAPGRGHAVLPGAPVTVSESAGGLPQKAGSHVSGGNNTIATALGVVPNTGSPSENILSGGINPNYFMQCKDFATLTCKKTKNSKDFLVCLGKLHINNCRQFNTFAALTDMSARDNIDLIKYYARAKLYLIHLVRFGANYPGVYYTIGKRGNLVDLVFGAQNRVLDIRKAPNYAQIAARFPQVVLFSVVDKLPKAQKNPKGEGIRLVLRFALFNGCHACAHAGYAYIAYDFSKIGALERTTILSLDSL